MYSLTNNTHETAEMIKYSQVAVNALTSPEECSLVIKRIEDYCENYDCTKRQWLDGEECRMLVGAKDKIAAIERKMDKLVNNRLVESVVTAEACFAKATAKIKAATKRKDADAVDKAVEEAKRALRELESTAGVIHDHYGTDD